jgi:hypothetical protein
MIMAIYKMHSQWALTMWKFVDEFCNYAKLIPLERIISYNNQRHNNSSQSHNTIKRINWRINAMYLTNNDVTDNKDEFF